MGVARKIGQVLGEMAVFALTAIGIGALAVSLGLLMSGCAPQKRTTHMVQQPISQPVEEPASLKPVRENVAPPQPEPEIRQTIVRKPMRFLGSGAKELIYAPGKKHVIRVTETGVVTVILPEGERIITLSSGASGEWPIEKGWTGLEGEFQTLLIGRYPQAPLAEAHVLTDAAVHSFILQPDKGSVHSKKVSLFVLVNPDGEARKQEREALQREADARYRKDHAPRVTHEEFSRLGRGQ